MSKTAFIFPGQGSQYAGMGYDLASKYPLASAIYEEADQILGFPLSQLCFHGPDEELKLTENTQPAILATSVAIWKILEHSGFKPHYVTGHSLGEYSALVVSGSLSLTDALTLVRKRGQYMQEAVPVGQGAMAAIVGLPCGQVVKICEEAADGEIVAPANINLPDQIVIAGSAKAVERAIERAKRFKAKAIKLPVSAPFHCLLMRPAQEKLSADMMKTNFRDLDFPLVTNVDAKLIRHGPEAADALLRQVTAPVRWVECISLLISQGVSTFLEIGPGKVLTGLVRKINPNVKCFSVQNEEGLLAFLQQARS